MTEKGLDLAWNLMTELRKETLEAQRMRTQVIGFKITFVSTAIGVIYAKEFSRELLAIPAFASIFFDLLIVSYSVSIRRIGLYCKRYIEPRLRSLLGHGFCSWEDFFETKQMRPVLAVFANLGFTALALAPAIAMLREGVYPYKWWILVALVILFLYDVVAFFAPGVITKEREGIMSWLFFGRSNQNKISQQQ
jgi:hypothetical protein